MSWLEWWALVGVLKSAAGVAVALAFAGLAAWGWWDKTRGRQGK